MDQFPSGASSSDPRPKPRVIPVPSETVEVGDSPRSGDASARVVLIAYSDYECPGCGQFARNLWPQIEKKYVASGRMQFVAKHLPLKEIHRNAQLAAEAAECAGRQDLFWPMHYKLFEQPQSLDRESLLAKAKEIHVNLATFGPCLDGDAAGRVRSDAAEAERFGIKGTPTLLLGMAAGAGRVRVSKVFSGGLLQSDLFESIDKLVR